MSSKKNGVFPVWRKPLDTYLGLDRKIPIMLKLACAFYMVWLLAVLIFQFSEPMRRRLGRIPFFLAGLMPTWRLFAPRPIDGDLYLYYRTRKDGESEFTSWQLLRTDRRTPLAVGLFFDPGRAMARALQDVYSRVCRCESSSNVYYQLLLQHVIYRVRADASEGQIQFRIERRSPQHITPLFDSHVHSL